MVKKDESVVEKIKYEEALLKLEESVRHLEKGDLTLEDSLKAFEDGIRWARVCEQKLSEAKGKVLLLIKKAGAETDVKEFNDSE